MNKALTRLACASAALSLAAFAAASPAAAAVKPVKPKPSVTSKVLTASCAWKGIRSGNFEVAAKFEINPAARTVTIVEWGVSDRGQGLTPYGVNYNGRLSYAPNPPVFSGKLDNVSKATGKVSMRVNGGEKLYVSATAPAAKDGSGRTAYCTAVIKMPFHFTK